MCEGTVAVLPAGGEGAGAAYVGVGQEPLCPVFEAVAEGGALGGFGVEAHHVSLVVEGELDAEEDLGEAQQTIGQAS
ncbi:hypothetical protein ACIPXV_27075 [Streptomyces libani]|uniref:hypothetical protein n=1 Tax=Streptomyces nigrescens TaxID=1920 RepID=UPI003830C9BF